MAKGSHQILIVDDLPDWRMTLGGLLTDAGYQVQVAGSTTRALELLRGNRFDLAVLDIRLDESNEDNTEGLDLAAEIRKSWPDVKIIIVTGYNISVNMQQALEPNSQGQKLADDYIPKDQSGELIQVVQKALAH